MDCISHLCFSLEHGMAGALERKKAGFVGAALKALQSSIAALPAVKNSEATTALLFMANPQEPASASLEKVSSPAGQSCSLKRSMLRSVALCSPEKQDLV